MHPHIEKLYQSAEKPERLIIGLMSGTSLDGLDVALCRISGSGRETQVTVQAFTTCPYPKAVKDKILTVFAKQTVDLEYLTLLNAWIGKYHGELINQCLKNWQVEPSDIDVIASHGQTIFHCPKHQHHYSDFGNATLQIGDADHIAVTTGITTVADFRQKHIAAGGEGAPLALYGDYYYFASDTEHRVLLNMGGIANLTYLPKGTELEGVVCSDLGPGNTLMDAYMRQHFSQPYDENAQLASLGTVNQTLLDRLQAEPFFALPLPKTTGPEVFNLEMLEAAQRDSSTEKLSHQDIMATLSALSAQVIARHINTLCTEQCMVYSSGGGVHNPLLMSQIKQLLAPHIQLHSSDTLGIHPDAKEAVLFAMLANECLAGKVTARKDLALPQVTMGKVSFAD
ncbi:MULTISPECIES: anhydro-N-acetylmuramic acid kinase [Pseudoalteromonas]|uniref:Anhydro-N-acetylmuramic acid kinase n=1 Tax=Pseudoalteromonas amylolytica TaxID=1859457 RepID=A0A1S1MQ41_9GAMM|nr:MULTISPECIES: anhydro-N-acetylmuramic acid kinase [Pseudoalteromonas]MCF6437250.1 anhydro-N-acetylmuramic acid kinase [Pseudoalteromonas sp. MMG022]OHU84352.1 anhydro-N-acetylmuramic acid kinase [Pseudoalteromonas sp. JW3]OHU87109.1 anhydro-N-acetylmuramic acid kinase [Pseudoalteromonas amylolytica]